MKKLLIIIALVLLLLVALLSLSWRWLTTTESGANWVLNRATGVLSSLSWERAEGDLRSGLVIHGLRLEEAGTLVDVGRLELATRVHLPPSPRVEVFWLRAFDARVELAEGTEAETEPEPFELPDLASPIEIRVHELLIRNLTLVPSGADSEPLRFERIALQGRYFDVLDLDSLVLEMPDLKAGASGTWGLSAPFAGELALNASYQIAPELTQALEARIHGDLDRLSLDLQSAGPATLSGEVELSDLLGELGLALSLSGRFSDWPDLDLAVEDLNVDGRGSLENWELSLAGRVTGPEIPENRWRFDLGGDLETVDVRNGQVEVLNGQIDMTGRASLSDGPQASANVSLKALDLTVLYPDWPQQAGLNGGFRLDASPELIRIEGLDLSAPPSALRLAGHGHWAPESDQLAAELNWSEFNWPPVLDDSEPLLYSQSGTLSLTGGLSDWQAELEAALRLTGQPQASIEAAASGSESGAEIRRLRMDAGTAGSAEARGVVSWAPELSGELDLRLSEFNTGQFVPELPGLLDLDLNLVARTLDDIRIDLRRLDGVLRDQPVRGQGRLNTSTEAASGGALALSFGDNRIELTSDDGRIWQVDLMADALRQLAPPAAGRLSARAEIDLDRSTLSAQAELHDSGWEEISLTQARLDTRLTWQEEQIGGRLNISLEEVDLSPWERLDLVELNIDGDCRAHSADLRIGGQRGSVDVLAEGALDACVIQGISAWNGAIQSLGLRDTMAGDWELNQPLALALSAERITASRACLVEATGREGRLCLRELDVAESGRIEIGIEQVPMDLLLVALDPTFNLSTPLSGELQAGWSQAQGVENIAGFLELERGALKPLGETDSLLDIKSVRLDLIPETDHLRLVLDALIEGDSRLTGQAQLVDLNDPSSATVDARARLNLPDVGVFNRLVTELDQLGGRLSGEMDIRGALLGPSLNGQLRLDDGLIVYAPLGVRMEDIMFELTGTEERATLRGDLHAGDGSLALLGDMELIDDQWRLDVRIHGERFRFTDVDWLRLSASPEIRLSSSGNGLLMLDGDIQVDHLRAGLPPGTEQRINASPDVRRRGDLDQDDSDEEASQRLQGRLGLNLGNDARVSAIGMQAQLAGGMELLWDGESTEPRARGVIRIPEGSYRAYGQNLQIEDGEVIFTGHAIDNPRLNINAVRDIFGDAQVERAGVQIRGNAQDPRISLFTDPPTSEEKALAYVVTGADFDHASGQGAINVGFYLLPRLFVSYGIGLFEAGDVLSARFELSRRWGVRVVSGERDTGVDLSFAIDR